MTGLLGTWRRLTQPHPAITDQEERRQARLLLSLILPLAPIAFVMSLVAPMIAGDSNPFAQPAAFVGVVSAILLVLAYGIARTRHHQLAASIVVAVVNVGAWGAFIAARHETDSEFFLSFLALGLLLSGLLLTLAATLALCVLDLVGVLALPYLFPDLPPSFSLVPSLFVGITAFLVSISAAVRGGDMVQRRSTERALRMGEERYRNLVESSPDGIVLVSGDRIVYANPAAARLFGTTTPSELVGLSPLQDLVVPQYVDVIEKRMAAIEREGARTEPLEIRVRRRDGQELDVEVMGAPAMHDGQPADQTIVRDITARKEAAAARSRIERLEEVNALKTQLLNMASHELNTPIAALRLQLHMLKRDAPDEDPRRARALLLLDRNVDRLALLVKDILDVARMQSGQLKLRREPQPLKPILEEAVELYAQAYLEKGVNLAVEGEDLMVDADAQRITQVVVNLLSNALKFTPQGGQVRVRILPSDDAVTVRVEDSGKGLAPEQIARLFQPFGQVHDASREQVGGTGLGLHISRGIMEQHGGRIWCESEGPGRGTTFAFSFPVLGKT